MSVIVEAKQLVKEFGVETPLFAPKKRVKAVSGVDLAVEKGETFSIVGESGCGKSTLARLLTRLLTPTDGDVLIDGQAVARLNGKELTTLRGKIQFIFQDPFSSLNPRMNIAALIAEPMEIHRPDIPPQDRRSEVARLLEQVGLRAEYMDRYPHEFSGGQRQRIGIARALAAQPEILVGDEPVSALDVSVQAQVINLLGDLKAQLGLTLIVIAHDLAVVRHMSDRIAVMYLGKIVELGRADDVVANAQHPYTQALMSAVPEAYVGERQAPIALEGEIPSPIDPPSGCRFRTRCAFAQQKCTSDEPSLHTVSEGHSVACHFYQDIAAQNTKRSATEHPISEIAARRFGLFRAAVSKTTDPEKSVSKERK